MVQHIRKIQKNFSNISIVQRVMVYLKTFIWEQSGLRRAKVAHINGFEGMPFCCFFITSVKNTTSLMQPIIGPWISGGKGEMSSRKTFYTLSNNNTGTFYVLHLYHCISLYQKLFFQSLTIDKGEVILTYGLKYDLGYVKGFSDICSKSIERPDKRQEITVILI